jgi:hypothetical protein
VCVCLLVAACQDKHDGGGASIAGMATPPLQATVNSAIATDRIAPSPSDERHAATGNQFVVLDVSVRNPGTQPQVFSEGKIVAVSESGKQAFALPVNIFADGYLSLQVLPPSASTRGKIVFEVPAAPRGVLYWVPGTSPERILLHPGAPPLTGESRGIDAGARVAAATRDRATPAVEEDTAAARVATRDNAPATPARPAPGTTPPGNGAASSEPAPTTRTAAPANGNGAQARTLACNALLSRNDPAERARYLGFFRRECTGYALPPSWIAKVTPAPLPPPPAQTSPPPPPQTEPSPPPRESPPPAVATGAGPTWPPRPGPTFDCTTAVTRAEHLVCDDAVLSLMDWELARAFDAANRAASDPTALEREEADWRRNVRDACTTLPCLEAAYKNRTAELTARAQAP